MSEGVLVDTGFWITRFDPREAEHGKAVERADFVERLTLVFPWPLLYEVLRTRFVRRPDWVARLDERLKRPKVVFVDDHDYYEQAYALTVDFATRFKRPISMVDMLCRLIRSDPKIRIRYLLTINPRDFHDVCRSNRVEIL